MTEHFTRKELERSEGAVRRGLPNVCPGELLPNMQLVAERLELPRNHFALPMRVLPCYRSEEVNKAVGGSKTSAHTKALAADVEIEGVSVLELCKWCADNVPDYDQIIYEFGEDGWMHIGFTKGKPRKQLLTAYKENGKTKYKAGF